MRFASRFNSFLRKDDDLSTVIKKLSSIEGLTDVDLNYPEHFQQLPVNTLTSLLKENQIALNGASVRFRDDFLHGEFGPKVNTEKAVELVKETIDVVGPAGGNLITLWLAYDGNDYAFQNEYERSWERVIESVRTIADYNPRMQISIEFKPFEPRSYSIVPGTGYTLHLIDKIGRENVGLTLDYCHMLMGGENPAMGLAISASEGRLFGVHLNDGYGYMDDGLMFSSISLVQSFEFLYYLKKHRYSGIVYFDTFPVREDPYDELRQNIEMFNTLSNKIDNIGMHTIQEVIEKRDGIASQKLVFKSFL